MWYIIYITRKERAMAIYVTSDLHGLEVERLEALLKKVNFSDSDWLYILGDVIDRTNDGGVALLRWCTYQPNVQLILGNHEAMLLACDFLFDEINEESIDALSADKLAVLERYTRNGGDVTLNTLQRLNAEDREELFDILDYLRDAPLYETVSVGGRDFILVHGGLKHFSPEKKLSEYAPDELLWCRPLPHDKYFTDIITVVGHTPTFVYERVAPGKILKMPTWINVDVGVPYGHSPALLRLDDLTEFYLD